MENVFTISQKDLDLDYKLVIQSKNETYQVGDFILIKYMDKLKKNIQFAVLSNASFLVRKHLEITNIPPVYRKK